MIKIGFSDDNSTIRKVVYGSVEEALDDLLTREIDCLIGGHDISTAEYLRKIFAKTKPSDGKRVYSYSVLTRGDERYFFADTGVNPELTEERLVELESLLDSELAPYHDIYRARVGYKTDGKMLQVDAALFPEIARKKGVKDPRPANTFVFPNLHAANSAYKLMQYLGEYSHVGPVLLGTGHFMSDLSRGASEQEIYDTAVYVADLAERYKRE
jgi:phosphate acetyltransferase